MYLSPFVPSCFSWLKICVLVSLEFRIHEKNLAVCRSMDYIDVMEFEWDLEKSNRCYLERGFDFAYAARAFFDPDRIVIKDTTMENLDIK